MISFRYHLTTLVAVFLALAVGVVLGGGPLSELGRSEEKTTDSSAALARAKTGEQQAEAALISAAPKLYAQGLKGKAVTVLRLPGVSDNTANAVFEQVKVAGGTTQVWEATSGLVGAGDKALVDTLGSQLLAQMPDGLITENATTYPRIGELIGVALASPKAAGDAGTDVTATVLDSLRTAKLLDGPATAPTRAPLVLVLAANPKLDGGVDQIHEGLLTGLAAQSVGVVLATNAKSDLAKAMSAAAVNEQVTVVDGAETVPGQVATVTGLVRSVTTKGGSFGVSGEDGTLSLL